MYTIYYSQYNLYCNIYKHGLQHSSRLSTVSTAAFGLRKVERLCPRGPGERVTRATPISSTSAAEVIVDGLYQHSQNPFMNMATGACFRIAFITSFLNANGQKALVADHQCSTGMYHDKCLVLPYFSTHTHTPHTT